MNIKKWIKLNTSSLKNKTIVVTGSYGGIFSEVAKILADLEANFIFLNKDYDKTIAQIQELKDINHHIHAEFIECDLSNVPQVKEVVKILKTKKIDILFLAAGVYNVPMFKTYTGFNNIFQVNFFSHYYITKELLPNIKSVNGKVIAVSSIAHNYSSIKKSDIDFSNKRKPSKIYGNSKRFLTYALQELRERENFNLSIVHPGITLTEMTNHYHKSINWLVRITMKLFFPNPKKAGLSFIKGIFENTEYHEWIGPSILKVYGYPKKQKLTKCSQGESQAIFRIAEKIYNSKK